MNKKTLLAAGIGLAFFGASALAAVGDPTDTVYIDWDGGGDSFTGVGSLDWAVGSSLSTGVVNDERTFEDGDGNTYTAAEASFVFETLTCTSNCGFELYSHAALQGYTDDGGDPAGITGLNSDFEWTYIFGGSENIDTQLQTQSFVGTVDDGAGGTFDVYDVTSTVTLSGDPQNTTDGFFFEIYYDVIDVNDPSSQKGSSLSGLGYNDGTLILEASELVDISGNFTSTLYSYIDVDGDGVFTAPDLANGILGDPLIASNGSGGVFALMDSFGGDNWGDGGSVDCDINANGETCFSVTGEGGTSLEALVNTATVDDGFFDVFFTDSENFWLITELVFSTENVDPFLETNPSGSYDVTQGGTTKDASHVFGSLVDTSGAVLVDVVNGSTLAANCQFAGNAADIATCLAAVTAGEDILFQTDANQGFRTDHARVPEPGTMALLGLGLGFLGLSRRRRRA